PARPPPPVPRPRRRPLPVPNQQGTTRPQPRHPTPSRHRPKDRDPRRQSHHRSPTRSRLTAPPARDTRNPAPLRCATPGAAACPITGGFSGQAGNHGGTGYPQLRLLALVACGTRTVIDAVFGPTTSGETSYARALLRSLRPGMILLADR